MGVTGTDFRTVGAARASASSLLAAAGVPGSRAERTATILVCAEVWGLRSHGLLRLPHYLNRLISGGCRPDAELAPVTDTGPLLSLDGQDGLGHWQAWAAAERARDRCREYGVAAVTVGRSSHCGALGTYVLPLASAGLVGLAFSNGPAVMPPWDGHSPVVSTSPIAAGFPTGEAPAVVDLATSAVARGRIAAKAAAGESLPPGWAFDADGSPTLDSAAALRGMLAPLGGAKGFALAFAVEALTGGAVGPALSTGVADMLDPADAARPQRISHTIIAFDPARTSVEGDPAERYAALVAGVREAGGRVPGQGRTAPDEIAAGEPVTVPESVVEQLADWAGRLGLR